ncbi:MAG: hypothetical protein A2931_02020 [Candidatus Niyogibacteria bacterium RIFCSPLOWO2_01_FULL_45_48]|uniref:Uncharacterized protein n=2 Tax=Candidatus Niyogiibacteriota TaxID=1817912 RepID=A0A1G2EZX6_9BACT|nr:MAG: hypothetical protein A2835_02625 [Candidatus Niyogibacteria bacterium RIFCSPHIGHO2_01_FULL_45_28]OGZ30672.1 MAG: hypothetical protein A2931_02020 [Candidatus Niyogibacteria bacterium RIFCSPLOWO2_01_FULL_45_48]OGZ31247.1 MAG: hypothetical protein A3J00_01740 [Candidatus Niyogibacteria bacterium RIFCSPLOWO2_02_FULL_45_13]
MTQNRIDAGILRGAIERSWCKDTCNEPNKWSKENPAGGQCVPTALVVQDFFGGKIIRLDLSKSANPRIAGVRSHYFNEIGGKRIDFSASQFSQDYFEVQQLLQNSGNVSERSREELFKSENVKARYLMLRLAVARDLSGCNPLFKNAVYRRCLLQAFQSDCEKSKFGCVARRKGREVAAGFNHKLDCFKDWCEPECIRKKITSRTESMIGCCAHAEEVALVSVRDQNIHPAECDFYVAGISENGLVLVKAEPVHSCIRCSTQFLMHHAQRIHVPCDGKWARVLIRDAVRSAKKYALGEKKV